MLYQPSIGVSLKTKIISILQRDLCSIYEDIGFGYILAQRSIQNQNSCCNAMELQRQQYYIYYCFLCIRHNILYGVFVVLLPISTTLPFAARRRDAVLSGFSILSSYRGTNKYLHFHNNEENCDGNSQFILSSSFAESTSLLT